MPDPRGARQRRRSEVNAALLAAGKNELAHVGAAGLSVRAVAREMGMAPSADLGDKYGLFQPAHGSAPDIAGQGKANPTAMMLSGVMMLRYLNENAQADRLKKAIMDVLAEGKHVTRDVRPDNPTPAGTSQVADAVIAKLKKKSSKK